MNVIVLEDEPLYLELLGVALSQYANLQVVGTFTDGRTCLEQAPALNPHVALLDIELPGGMNGIEVGLRLREKLPDLGIVILSNHRDSAFLTALRNGSVSGWSYLLKRTVSNVDVLRRAIEGAAQGLVVLDHQLIADSEPRLYSRLGELTSRQREILELIAQGYSNAAIAEKLSVSIKTVENHINVLYQTLGVPRDAEYQPRVLAVLKYLDQIDLRKIG